MRTRLSFLNLISVLLVASTASALAQDEATNKTVPKLPAHPAMWINSPPITNEMLAGKSAVLYFFDEQCPRCVEAWPRVLLQAAKFDGTPLMFIGVNSGTSRPQLESYLKKYKVNWPVICDTDRSFEAQFVFTISLENIKQVRLLTSTGSFKSGDPDNIEGSAVEAMKGAKWKVEPQDVPTLLQPAWLAIEFGKYPDAALLLKKNLNGKGELKEAAQRLQQVVLDDLNSQVEAATKSFDEDKKWDAFKRFSAIPIKFKGYSAVPASVTAKIKELSSDETIKEEQAALKMLDNAIQTASRSPTGRKAALKQLQKLIEEHSKTEAASEAQKLIEQAQN